MTIKSRKFSKGIRTKPTTDAATLEGEQRTDSADNKQKVYLDGSERSLVTEDQAQTMTNKTIDSASNTITVDADNATVSNIETDNLKAGVLVTDISAATSDTELPSALAVKTAIDGQNEASEISYDNTSSGLTATDVQAAVDEVEARLDTAESNISTGDSNLTNHLNDAVDAHDATAISYNNVGSTLTSTEVNDAIDDLDAKAVNNNSAITNHLTDTNAHTAANIVNVPSGNLAATDVQDALNELQTELDGALSGSDLTTHESDTSTHGVTTIAGISETQVFTNKDIDGGTASNTSRITLPKDTTTNLDLLTNKEGTVAYDTSKKSLVYNDGSVWNEAGSGGSGGINYLEGDSTDFENSVGDWTGETGFAATYGGGASTILRGNKSFFINKSAGDQSGKQVKVPFTIDLADNAKKLTISMDFGVEDDYNDDDMIIKVIQDPAGTPIEIPVNGSEIKAGARTHYAQFQTDHTEKDYELVIEMNSTNTAAMLKGMDNVRIGPTNLAFGVDTKIQQSSLTGASFLGTIRRFSTNTEVGDTELITYSDDGTNGTRLTANLDNIYVNITYQDESDGSNSNSITNIRVNGASLSNAWGYVSATGVEFDNTTHIKLDQGDYIDFSVNSASRFVTSGNARVEYIATRKNTTQMSEDLGGRDIFLDARGDASTQSIANNIITKVTNWSIDSDTVAGWDSGNNRYDVLETGYYTVSAALRYTADVDNDETRSSTLIFVNDISVFSSDHAGNGGVQKVNPNVSGTLYLQKGDYIDVRAYQVNSDSDAITIDGAYVNQYFTLIKIASSQTMLETETVAARYESSNGQSVPTTLGTNFIAETLKFDTHNAYNTSTGEYTVPTSGIYHVSVKMHCNAPDFLSNGTFFQCLMQNNGSNVDELFFTKNGVSAGNMTDVQGNGSCIIKLEKGDVITCDFRENSSDSLALSTNGFQNVFSIARIK